MTEKELYDSMNEQKHNGFVQDERYGNQVMPALMRKVYTWMALALAITGVVSFGVASSPTLVASIFSSSSSLIILLIAELALVWWMSARIDKLTLSTATVLFIVYSVLNGVTLSCIFLVYTMSSIATVFFITAATFGAMALYGYTTKTDLSSMGKILFMGLIGIIIATVVNLFLKNSMLDMIISYVGVLIFVGLTAWDTQKIKRMLTDYAGDMSENSQKIALMGALTLYLDFINLFIYLLRIFGKKN